MRRALLLVMIGLALFGLSRWLSRGTQEVLAAAQEAYRQGEYAQAVQGYQQAAPESGDLAGVAHNQAAALYRLGRYADAEGRYQVAESRGDARRAAQSEYDRGNCLLRQARCCPSCGDVGLLRQAADHFQACLDRQDEVVDGGTLFSDARHNLELAKLLQLAQTQGGDKDESPRAADAQAAKDQGDPDPAAGPEPPDAAQALVRKDDAEEECPT